MPSKWVKTSKPEDEQEKCRLDSEEKYSVFYRDKRVKECVSKVKIFWAAAKFCKWDQENMWKLYLIFTVDLSGGAFVTNSVIGLHCYSMGCPCWSYAFLLVVSYFKKLAMHKWIN